ncbi:MAG: IPT/TIG domain-containing protein, partial [Ilumatobacteraceae bacterium]
TASTSLTILSATSIRVVTPAKIAGVVDVVLITPGGSRTLTAGFTYRAAPKVTSISPVSGPLAGGTKMTITGTGFVVGATVKIGGVKAANVVVSSSKSITAVTFTHVAGVVDVVVTNPGKQFATLVGGFTYRALPAKSSSAIIVKHLAGKSTIALSFPVAYAGKCVTIELGFDEDGQVKFQVVGSVILDASGNGVFTFQRLITSEIVIRAKIDLKTVAELMRPGAIPLPRPPRKIVVERLAGISTIELSLQDKYAQKRVSIELGLGVDGQVKFQVVGSVILDSSGKGVLKLQRAIPAEAVVRARIASVIVAERMRMTLC